MHSLPLVRLSALAGAVCLLASACATPRPTAAVARGGLQKVALTLVQEEAVQSGVRQMVARPDTAKLSHMSALAAPGKPEVHVCGYVSYQADDGEREVQQEFYIELREVGGRSVAERGQVGTTASATSKVRFVCRNHPGR